MNRVRELRIEKGWRQEDLAQRLNTRQQSIGRYETGERGLDLETIDKLCEIFGVTSDYLLGRSPVRTFELTDAEAQLLQGFRSLSPAGREYLLHTLALAQLAHSEKNGAVSDVEAAK